MPAIEIRPAQETDIPALLKIDHSYASGYVWQMETEVGEGRWATNFRQVRLPRTVRVEYPRSPKTLNEDWSARSGLLVAVWEQKAVGYASLMQNIAPMTTWATDLVVAPDLRRQGVGSALVLAAMEWAASRPDSHRLVLEMQHKNHPAIQLAQKLGFDYCGFNDHYYINHDIALFFARWIR